MKLAFFAAALLAGIALATPAKAFTVSNPGLGADLGPFDLGVNTVSGDLIYSCFKDSGCGLFQATGAKFTTQLPSNLQLTSASVNLTSLPGGGTATFYSLEALVNSGMIFSTGDTGNLLKSALTGPLSFTWFSGYSPFVNSDRNVRMTFTWTFKTEAIGAPGTVPLPATLPLLASALAGFALLRRRRFTDH